MPTVTEYTVTPTADTVAYIELVNSSHDIALKETKRSSNRIFKQKELSNKDIKIHYNGSVMLQSNP